MKSYLIIGLIFISCNYKDETTKSQKIDSTYIKAEVYCFCLEEHVQNNQTFYFGCSTPASLPPYELIESNKLSYSTNDKMIIKRLENLFFSKREKIDTLIYGSDTRFVVLLKKNDFSADTLVLDDEHSFNFNEKSTFTYSFAIMDSLRNVFNKKTLSCR